MVDFDDVVIKLTNSCGFIKSFISGRILII